MKRSKTRFLFFFFCLCLSFCMVMPKQVNAEEQIVPVKISVKYGQTEARSILKMINNMRTSSSDAWYWNENDTRKTVCKNLQKLTYDYDLEKIAMKRAAEIALSYSHTRPNGEICMEIFDEEGISDYWALGENIAAGYMSAEAVNKGWREDDQSYIGQGHRRNMLSSKYNCVGIGHVYYNGYHYWVEEFAYRASVTTKATTAKNDGQVVSVPTAKKNITNFKVAFDKSKYFLQAGKSVTVKFTNPTITVKDQWPYGADRVVADIPTLQAGNASVVSCKDGKLLGLSNGTTTIKASLYGVRASASATVSVQGNGNSNKTSEKTTKKIKLNRKSLTLKKGKSFKLKVTLTPKDSEEKVTYKSSDKKVVTVSKTGKIRAKKKGTAKITVISGKKKAVCKVKVK